MVLFCKSSKKAEEYLEIKSFFCISANKVNTNIYKALLLFKPLAGSNGKRTRSITVAQVNINSNQPVNEETGFAKLVSIASLKG